MKVLECKIPGCFEIIPNIHRDNRGSFVKTFHAPTFRKLGLCSDFVEEYYSVSHQGVIRGMHFQLPPHDHVKVVYCTSGTVMDVVVDLRKGSPTFGKFAEFELSAEKGNMVYIPKGLAHGFCVLSESATMLYKVSTVYAPESDAGIKWDSIGLKWPFDNPVISSRDKEFISFTNFDSPFHFEVGNE